PAEDLGRGGADVDPELLAQPAGAFGVGLGHPQQRRVVAGREQPAELPQKDGRSASFIAADVRKSEQVEAQAAEDTAAQLRAELPQLRVGLVHGRMRAEEKDL
ncbi:UNVERIFIED_CONTAM: hypothetical protein IGO34_26845, partial [Salmonella enterica subsp. enterica serovar Weltevreden]